MVPVDTVWTVVVVVINGEALELVVASHVPTPAPTTTTMAAPTMVRLRVNHRRGAVASVATVDAPAYLDAVRLRDRSPRQPHEGGAIQPAQHLRQANAT
jgi:hypothetical protein